MDVNRLTKRVEAKLQAIKAARARQALPEREQVIASALEYVPNVDYWCEGCRMDCTGPGRKIVQTLFKGPRIAFYEGKCPVGHRLRRRITDQQSDPYYHDSKLVRMLKDHFAKDLLQPGQAGFNTLYGDPNAQFYAQLEEAERLTWKRRPTITV